MNLFNWNELQIFAFFFVFVRVSSMFLFLPLFGDKTVAVPIKILFGLALSFVVFPFTWTQGLRVDPAILESSTRTSWAIATEMAFGMLTGFVARWIFDAVQFAGHFAGTAMGFSMASVLDPHNETQTVAYAQLHYVMAAMLFLGMDGHHIYMSAILDSFTAVKPGAVNLLAQGDAVSKYLIDMTAEVITLGLKLSAPIVVVLLLVNLAFGMVARTVPQLNVFVISFALNIGVGLFVAIVSLPGFMNMVQGAFESYTPELYRFMRLFGG